jgi:hypothetical protein
MNKRQTYLTQLNGCNIDHVLSAPKQVEIIMPLNGWLCQHKKKDDSFFLMSRLSSISFKPEQKPLSNSFG